MLTTRQLYVLSRCIPTLKMLGMLLHDMNAAVTHVLARMDEEAKDEFCEASAAFANLEPAELSATMDLIRISPDITEAEILSIVGPEYAPQLSVSTTSWLDEEADAILQRVFQEQPGWAEWFRSLPPAIQALVRKWPPGFAMAFNGIDHYVTGYSPGEHPGIFFSTLDPAENLEVAMDTSFLVQEEELRDALRGSVSHPGGTSRFLTPHSSRPARPSFTPYGPHPSNN